MDADVNFSSATGGGYWGGLVVEDQVGDRATCGGSFGLGGFLLLNEEVSTTSLYLNCPSAYSSTFCTINFILLCYSGCGN